MKIIFILVAFGALAMLALTAFSRMMNGGAQGGRRSLGSATTLVAIPAAIADQISDFIANGQKIDAIKLLREETGCSLVEAKDTIDALAK